MQIDERALEILDLKRSRLRAVEAQGAQDRWLTELPGLLKWILSVPILAAYVKQIVAMHAREDAELVRATKQALDIFATLASELRAAPITSGDAVQRLYNWQAVDEALKYGLVTTSEEDRRKQAEVLAKALDAHRMATWNVAVEAKRTDEFQGLSDRIRLASEGYLALIDEHDMTLETSPRSALVRIVDVCRALRPPPDDLDHWTDFLPRERFKPYIDSGKLKEDKARIYTRTIADVDRFIEELHVLGATTLSRRVLIERFKERCTWYDKARLRDVAESGRGTREDRLTLELAKYLHDAGLFVLVRPRVTNLEPDVVGLQGTVVEAKAYADSGSARADITHGFYQLHAYLTSLETEAMRVTEGFLVAFRLGGPIYETPPTIDTGRFLIHSLSIDLGESDSSGRKQPPTAKITEEEIGRALEREVHDVMDHLGRQRLGHAHGTTRLRRRSRASGVARKK